VQEGIEALNAIINKEALLPESLPYLYTAFKYGLFYSEK